MATSAGRYKLRFPVCVAETRGWAQTRLNLSSLEIVPLPPQTDPELPMKPGVHFKEAPEITADDLMAIINGETPDAWVNEIVRTFLGWRQMEDGTWNNENVQDVWKKSYPQEPPDFIGKEGDYTPETDKPVKFANQNLTRSIPPPYKQQLKPVMKPFGFSGWKIKDLTPNRTRRATAVNWMLYWYVDHYPEYKITKSEVSDQ